MPFWRRNRDETPEPPARGHRTRAGRSRLGAGPGRLRGPLARAPGRRARARARTGRPRPDRSPSLSRLAEPEPEPIAEPAPRSTEPETPAPGAFDPTAFLAVAKPGSIDAGLERSRGGFMSQLRGYLGGADGPAWDEVEETLIAGDVGASLAIDVVERARKRRDPDGPEAAVRAELSALLVRRDLDWEPRSAVEGGPAVVLIVGVNGTGKTTTIGKLATRYAARGPIDHPGRRGHVPRGRHRPAPDLGRSLEGADDRPRTRRGPGRRRLRRARCGRRARRRPRHRRHRRPAAHQVEPDGRADQDPPRSSTSACPGAAPETLFVLDATTGQNGLAQAVAFHEAVGLTGIVLTKLDSTAKGGIVFAIEHALDVPVRFVGVGEAAGDLIVFDPDAFVEALFA